MVQEVPRESRRPEGAAQGAFLEHPGRFAVRDPGVIGPIVGLGAAVFQELTQGPEKREEHQEAQDPSGGEGPRGAGGQGRRHSRVKEDPAQEHPLFPGPAGSGPPPPEQKNLQGSHAREREQEETEVQGIEVGMFGVRGLPQKPVMVPMDDAVRGGLQAGPGTDEDIGQEVVPSLVPGDVEVGGLMDEKLEIGDPITDPHRADRDQRKGPPGKTQVKEEGNSDAQGKEEITQEDIQEDPSETGLESLPETQIGPAPGIRKGNFRDDFQVLKRLWGRHGRYFNRMVKKSEEQTFCIYVVDHPLRNKGCKTDPLLACG